MRRQRPVAAVVPGRQSRRSLLLLYRFIALLAATTSVSCFAPAVLDRLSQRGALQSSSLSFVSVSPIEEASTLLAKWDRYYTANVEAEAVASPSTSSSSVLFVDATMPVGSSPTTKATANDSEEMANQRDALAPAVRLLSVAAANERQRDSTFGRCMLGICASSASQGVETLKAWVTALDLPRGLLHGMDQDGVALELDGGVYIKYNSGGVYTFEEIRKSGLGFEALWKPGDAMLEPYDGQYRGVYFQVELSDGVFRQYLVPLDIF